MLHPKTHLREKADTEIPEVQHIPEHPAPTELPFIFSRILPWPLPNGKRTALSPKVDNLEGAWSPGTSNNPFLAPRAHRDKHRRDLTGWVLAQQGTGSTRNEAIQLKTGNFLRARTAVTATSYQRAPNVRSIAVQQPFLLVRCRFSLLVWSKVNLI